MAAQQLTLNQTVKLIKEIAQSHNQINTIYFGDVWEFLAQTDNVYPAMFYSLTGSSISGKNLAMDFSLFFLDRQLQDESNETDVLSDQLLIGQDIFSMMRYPKFDWKLGEDVTIEFFTENEKDFLSGVRLDITINYPMLTDRCQVPSSFSYPEYLNSISGTNGSTNYVKFLIDYPTFTDLPTEGDTGKIYVANDTNIIYRWVDGSWIALKTNSTVNWGSIGGTLSAQTDLQNALNLKAPLASPTFTGTVSGITKSMVGLANVDNTSDASKPISSATQTALNAKQSTIILSTNNYAGVSTLIGSTLNIPNYGGGFTSIAASASLVTLTANSPTENYISGSGGQTIKLPDATTLPNGATFSFNNNQSSGAVLVNNNSNTLIVSIPSGGYTDLILIDNSIAAGNWDKHFSAPANVFWSTNTFDYVGSITGATWNGVVVAPNRGGTGQSTYTDGQLLIGNSTGNTLSKATLSSGTGISITNGAGSISIASTITQYTDSNARASITLTTTGTSGAATYNSTTGVLNIPSYTGGGGGGASTWGSITGTLSSQTDLQSALDAKQNSLGFTPYNATNPNGYTSNVGTVTSVSLSVPTGLSITGSPITSSGTLAIGLTTGYSIPTTAIQTNWDSAYTNRITSLTTTGSSGSATLVSNVLNVPTYTLAGLGGQASSINLTSLSGLTYASASFVKMTASGTFSLDTNTYYLASNPSGYTNNTGTVTSVAALTLGTTGTDLSSSVATGTSTPVITLNVPTASATNRGVLSSTDWSTFNGKQGAITLTTTGSSGAATLVGNTLNIPNYAGGGGSFSGVLAVGTATTAPLEYTIASSVLKTTPIAGDFEADANGISYYSHADSSRGVMYAEQFISLSGTYTLTSQTAAQKLFNSTTNGSVTVKAATTYYFECFYSLSSMSGTTGGFGFALGGTATFTSLNWTSSAIKATTGATAGTLQTTFNTTAANTAIVSTSTQTGGFARITGTIRVNAGGTIIPQVSLSVAAAAIVGANSYFRIIPIGTNTVTSVGNWS